MRLRAVLWLLPSAAVAFFADTVGVLVVILLSGVLLLVVTLVLLRGRAHPGT